MPKSQRRSKHPEEMVTIGFCYLCLKCLRFSFLHRKRKFLFCCFRFKLRRIHTQPPKYFSVSGHIFRLSFCFLFKRAAHYLLTVSLVVSSRARLQMGVTNLIAALQWPKLVSQVTSSGFPPIRNLFSSNGRRSGR